ncbi:MAG: arginine N-succinyltransferase [Phycisphaerae bacterium]
MLVVRPIRAEDLPAMQTLAEASRGELTSLPTDPKVLIGRIEESLRAFATRGERAAGECYTFVMADEHGTLAGTSNIKSKTGGFSPFYSYELLADRYENKVLGVNKLVRALHLVEEHDGPAEIGGLFLAADRRRSGAGRLLSLARFMFMAQRPAAFDARVVAELRGVLDAHGNSPFWDALGRHFFETDFKTADSLSLVERRIMADLMPDHPIYIDLLPKAARFAVGACHGEAVPALRLLWSEGFRYNNRVDIFDAGPLVQANLPEIRTVSQCRHMKLAGVTDAALALPTHLVSNGQTDVRVVMTGVEFEGEVLKLPAEAASALQVEPGMTLHVAPARPSVDTSAVETAAADLFAASPPIPTATKEGPQRGL